VLKLHYDNSNPSISSLAQWRLDAAITPLKDRLLRVLAEEIKDKTGDAREKTSLALELAQTVDVPTITPLKNSISQADEDLKRLEGIDNAYLSSPIIIEKKGVHDIKKTIEGGLAPLYCILSMFVILMLASSGLIYDRKAKLFTRIKSTSSSFLSYLCAKYIFFISVAIVQFFIVLFLFYAFGARYNINIILLIKSIVYITLIDVILGIIIGLVSDSEGVAVLMSLMLSLPLLFLSGMFFPLQLMPSVVQWLAKIMPLEFQMSLLSKAILFGGEISLAIFIVPALLSFGIIYLLTKVQ
jgi:ABC-2 type transport system permease protein